jgi:ribose 5-phosphate isomerase RpiB
VHNTVRAWLEEHGHQAVPFGSVAADVETPWALAAESLAEAVARGDCDQGVFFCWTGTGISIAANKVSGIRAALCSDPPCRCGVASPVRLIDRDAARKRPHRREVRRCPESPC